MPTPLPKQHILLDAHESCGLASTILIARQLLEHDDLEGDQHERILESLARAATTLAHRVVTSEPLARTVPASDAA